MSAEERQIASLKRRLTETRLERDILKKPSTSFHETTANLSVHINARRPRRYVRTTKSNPADPVAPNLLERNFTAQLPATKWVSDLTKFKVDRR